MLQYLNETDYVSLLTGDLKNKTVVIQAAKGTTGRIVSLSNRISLLNNAYESIANEVENHFSHEEMKEYCLAQSPKDRIGKQPWFIKGFLKELSDASALDAQFLAELITPCVLPKKCDELADDYSMPGIVLCKYLPECPSAADYAECYRPYTETKAILPALKGLEKIVPDRIADYCAPGCVQKLAYIMKTKDYYEAQSAAHFLKLLYHAGYSKDEILTHRGFSKSHTDYGNRECTLHEDTPAFTFEL